MNDDKIIDKWILKENQQQNQIVYTLNDINVNDCFNIQGDLVRVTNKVETIEAPPTGRQRKPIQVPNPTPFTIIDIEGTPMTDIPLSMFQGAPKVLPVQFTKAQQKFQQQQQQTQNTTTYDTSGFSQKILASLQIGLSKPMLINISAKLKTQAVTPEAHNEAITSFATKGQLVVGQVSANQSRVTFLINNTPTPLPQPVDSGNLIVLNSAKIPNKNGNFTNGPFVNTPGGGVLTVRQFINDYGYALNLEKSTQPAQPGLIERTKQKLQNTFGVGAGQKFASTDKAIDMWIDNA